MSKLSDIFSEKMINVKNVGEDILTLDSNAATHGAIIDLAEAVVIKSVSVDSEVAFRFRVSKDGEVWFDWGHLDNELCRYINYEVTSSTKSVYGKVSVEICVPFCCDLTIPASGLINAVVAHESDGKGVDIKLVSKEDITSFVGNDGIKKEQLESGVACRVTNYYPKETSIRNVHFIV